MSDDAVKKSLTDFLKQQSKEFCEKGFRRVISHWGKFLNVHGNQFLINYSFCQILALAHFHLAHLYVLKLYIYIYIYIYTYISVAERHRQSGLSHSHHFFLTNVYDSI